MGGINKMRTYTISDSEDGNKVKRAMLADEAFECLYDLSQKLREQCKYGDLTDGAYEEMDKFREFFYETLEEKQISLDKYYI